MKDLTSANVGSAVRWLITTLGVYAASKGYGDNATWLAIAGGLAAGASLVWSMISNQAKVG